MSKNARQFLLNEVLTYYQETLMPELACLGVKSDRFVPLLEELAWEISCDLSLSEYQQKEFLEQLTDISIQMFDGDLLSHLADYKIKLQRYLESCYANSRR
ncbi:MAG: hypothetical protein HC820_10240 [Hydrococcus sp. RM1_1_31]|nr:hypothetical protein [Hydrococcus sp. RM1_1_31]